MHYKDTLNPYSYRVREIPIGTTHQYTFPAAKIETVKRYQGWEAHLADNPGVWEAGHSEAEAIGRLHMRLARESAE